VLHGVTLSRLALRRAQLYEFRSHPSHAHAARDARTVQRRITPTRPHRAAPSRVALDLGVAFDAVFSVRAILARCRLSRRRARPSAEGDRRAIDDDDGIVVIALALALGVAIVERARPPEGIHRVVVCRSVVVCRPFEPSAKSIAWTHRPVVTHHIDTTRRSYLRFL
jgi:hypothetical protein